MEGLNAAPLTPFETQELRRLMEAKRKAWEAHAAVQGDSPEFVPTYTAYQEAREAHLHSLMALESRLLSTSDALNGLRKRLEARRDALRAQEAFVASKKRDESASFFDALAAEVESALSLLDAPSSQETQEVKALRERAERTEAENAELRRLHFKPIRKEYGGHCRECAEAKGLVWADGYNGGGLFRCLGCDELKPCRCFTTYEDDPRALPDTPLTNATEKRR